MFKIIFLLFITFLIITIFIIILKHFNKLNTYKLNQKKLKKYKNMILNNDILKNIVKEYGYSIFTKKEYKEELKNNILKSILKEYDRTLIYSSDKSLLESDYKSANFDNYDEYISESLIEGSINNNSYVISNVKTKTHISSLNKEESVTSFQGIVAKISLPKNINSYVYILYNGLKTFTNDLYCLVDNTSFLERHDIYSNNEQLTLKLLPTPVTNALMKLEDSMKICFEIKIINDMLYLRFNTTDNLNFDTHSLEMEAVNLAKYIFLLEGTKIILRVLLDSINNLLIDENISEYISN